MDTNGGLLARPTVLWLWLGGMASVQVPELAPAQRAVQYGLEFRSAHRTFCSTPTALL